MDLVSILIFLGIVQGLFFGILILTVNSGNKTANRIMGILLIFFALSISGFLLYRTGIYYEYPHLIGLPTLVLFLFGPFFYFYVKALTRKKFSFKRKYLLHGIPFLMLIIFKIPFFFLNGEEKLNSVVDHQSYLYMQNMIILSSQTVHLVIYVIITRKLLKRYLAKIKNSTASIEKINLTWINFLIHAFLIIFGMIIVFLILYFFNKDYNNVFSVIIPVSVTIVIYIMGYWSFKQPAIFSDNKFPVPKKKYKKSTLRGEDAEVYIDKLRLIMEEEKLFLDTNLTLNKLAKNMDISPHHLSQVINEKTDQNFFDFVNSYRVKAARELLASRRGELLTVLAIGEEVGFNSKTAFNKAFKKHTGTTPSQYKKDLKIDSA